MMTNEEALSLLGEALVETCFGLPSWSVDQLDELGVWSAACDGLEIDYIGAGDGIGCH